ncbi:uncharacterized protein BO95DRAFT_446058, partial [Aspergillus brunneoviolaceus CBS 621.78]
MKKTNTALVIESRLIKQGTAESSSLMIASNLTHTNENENGGHGFGGFELMIDRLSRSEPKERSTYRPADAEALTGRPSRPPESLSTFLPLHTQFIRGRRSSGTTNPTNHPRPIIPVSKKITSKPAKSPHPETSPRRHSWPSTPTTTPESPLPPAPASPQTTTPRRYL